MQEADTKIVLTACGQRKGGMKMTQDKYVTTENKWNENDTNNGRQLQNVWNENDTEYNLKTKVRWIEYDTAHRNTVGIHTAWCNEIDTCYRRATRIGFEKRWQWSK